MRRSRAVAAGLAIVWVAASGCGMSTTEKTKPRDPSGQGQTEGPDVSVESTDELRAAEVVINRGRFQPQQVSIGLDSTVRITNRGDGTARIRALEGLVDGIPNKVLSRGETAELDFLEAGTERIGLEGSNARLEINVFQ